MDILYNNSFNINNNAANNTNILNNVLLAD